MMVMMFMEQLPTIKDSERWYLYIRDYEVIMYYAVVFWTVYRLAFWLNYYWVCRFIY